jgi:hypothetical protein
MVELGNMDKDKDHDPDLVISELNRVMRPSQLSPHLLLDHLLAQRWNVHRQHLFEWVED